MDDFNKNVRLICKHKGIPIGKCEKFINKSAGYFSRNPKITLFDAVSVALLLNEELTDMIYEDYEKKYRRQALIDRREQINKDIARLKDELEAIKEIEGRDNG